MIRVSADTNSSIGAASTAMTSEKKPFDDIAVPPTSSLPNPSEVTARQQPVTNSEPDTFYRFADPDSMREHILTSVKNAYATKSVQRGDYILRFADVDYKEKKNYSLQDETRAVLRRGTLVQPLYGRLQLIDAKTNQIISEDPKPRKLADVPWMTRRGTFIHNGNEYIVYHQQRLKPGPYVRRQQNGDIETHFNILNGASFRIHLEPSTGIFSLIIGQSKTPLYPLLKSFGVSDKTLVEHWGPELTQVNMATAKNNMLSYVNKVLQKVRLPYRNLSNEKDPPEKQLLDELRALALDPHVTKRSLQMEADRVSPEILLQATREMIRLNRGERGDDVRDDLANQKIYTPADLFREHVEKDAGKYLQKALYKSMSTHDVTKVTSGHFTKQLRSVLLGSGVSGVLTEINPIEIYDLLHKITRTGEGGISSEVVPRESRGVQPSHFGFIDPIRAPESTNIALDLRVAQGVVTSKDGRLLQKMKNMKTGSEEYVSGEQLQNKVIAFPYEVEKALQNVSYENGIPKYPRIAALVNGKMRYVPLDDVDYVLEHPARMWSPITYFIPFINAVKGQRVSMGARMLTQALALREPEAPLVQTAHPFDSSKTLAQEFGKFAGAVSSNSDGVVTRVSPTEIVVQSPDGKEVVHELYHNFPFNQKGFLHNTPVVKVGQKVRAGDLLARSNYTDEKGNIALGKNVLAAFHTYEGLTHEDAIVVSESAAKKFASEQMYEYRHDHDDDHFLLGRDSFLSKFPSKYDAQQLEKIDKSGVVKVGSIVQKGDPLFLALRKNHLNVKGSLITHSKPSFSDASEVWEHDEPGEVVAVEPTSKGWNVYVKTYTPLKEGDKLSGLYGNKGIVAKIVPDSEMLRTTDGRVIDVIMNPASIVSRVNPAQLAESLLAKITLRKGTKYTAEGFRKDSLVDFVMKELEKHGMSDTEDVYDPKTGRTLKDIFVGVPYILKLHHMSEGKMAARDIGGYTFDEQPAKGGPEGSKRIGLMEINSLLSHGAVDFLEDMKVIRGQRNDDYWRLYRMGLNPPPPSVSKVYEKFENTLRGAGVHLRKNQNLIHVTPATKQHIDELVGNREIENPETIDFDTGEPIPGGLFDLGKTGGKGGIQWSFIRLSEPLPNPIAEPILCNILNLTKREFEDILSGKSSLNGLTGSRAFQAALENFDVEKSIQTTVEQLKIHKKSERNKLVRRLGYLTMMKKHNIHPRDFIVDKVPVLPPKFRPVIQMQDRTVGADINYLYRDLFTANKNAKEFKEFFGDNGEQRLNLYHAYKAIAGLGSPITKESQDRNLKGLLRQVFGETPKMGMYQRKVIGNPVDVVGRAVLAPGHDIDLDEVGLPVDMVWKIYKPFIVRNLVKSGVPMTVALKEIENRSERATNALYEELKYRPVVINRAPSLHKYNLTGHFVRPVAGHTMKVNNLVLAGHAGDYDGDTLNIHVPVSDKAVAEVKEKLLPSRSLLSTRTFDIHLLPSHMFTTGLHVGTKPDPKKQIRFFATKADAIRAYKSGEIDADDPILIGKI